ncbi:hypothetical protein H1C71_001211 [Ictidomys tridecemlineatus]|nr:hypothetical protein H1C71_001211 [Ictidomys tridecemlineatus]
MTPRRRGCSPAQLCGPRLPAPVPPPPRSPVPPLPRRRNRAEQRRQRRPALPGALTATAAPPPAPPARASAPPALLRPLRASDCATRGRRRTEHAQRLPDQTPAAGLTLGAGGHDCDLEDFRGPSRLYPRIGVTTPQKEFCLCSFNARPRASRGRAYRPLGLPAVKIRIPDFLRARDTGPRMLSINPGRTQTRASSLSAPAP